MVACRLLLGSNLGDRKGRLRTALSRLDRLPGCTVLKRSRLYETSPVGGGSRSYLNLAAVLFTNRSPLGLLCELKRLEALAGRRPGPRWGDRPLDIDILSYGRLRLKTPWLILPHPRLASRAFVLAPLSELAPRWRPYGRETVLQLLDRLNPDPGSVKIFKGRPLKKP